MKLVRWLNILMLFILLGTIIFETYILAPSLSTFLNRNFNFITTPLWISISLFAFNSFKKNSYIYWLTGSGLLILALYFIIS